jgi:hypothetical protein
MHSLLELISFFIKEHRSNVVIVLRCTKGNKIHYEMAPMSELLVERGQIPGDSPHTLTGLDFALHDPRDRFSVLGLRMCGGGLILDRKNWEPVCFISADEKGKDN